jgi:4-hydroxy-3-methylbut-2-enyl diphosphate reductase
MGFQKTLEAIRKRIKQEGKGTQVRFISNDTICRQVSNRAPQVREFAAHYEVIIFVSDSNSSNGTFLFEVCKETNPRSYFVTAATDLDVNWFKDVKSVGISGATSTPLWVMEEVKKAIEALSV